MTVVLASSVVLSETLPLARIPFLNVWLCYAQFPPTTSAQTGLTHASLSFPCQTRTTLLQSYEIDPSRLHKTDNLQRNQEKLWELFLYVAPGKCLTALKYLDSPRLESRPCLHFSLACSERIRLRHAQHLIFANVQTLRHRALETRPIQFANPSADPSFLRDRALCTAIFKSADKVPCEFRRIFQRIRLTADTRFGTDPKYVCLE